MNDKENITDDAQEVQQGSRGKSPSNVAHLGKTIEIDLNKERREYSNGLLKAYSAQSDQTPCFAIICDARFTPRFNSSGHYKEVANPSVPLLVASGSITMPDGTPGPYAFVYADNLGAPIYKESDIIAPSWKADTVLTKIAMPIITLLKDFHTRDLVHGNIRATNLFNGGREQYETVKLGDCLSLPASMAQPFVYETIERCMADPISRGQGTIKDDLYSLGVLIAMHLRSYDPLKGKSNNEILSSKVVNGSYSALIGGNDRFSGGILELLRGLLIDDAKQRWGMEEVMAWLDGRRLSPKQAPKKKKATRGLQLGDISYYYSTTLAHNLVQKPQEAVQLIENNELMHWVERTLDDEEMARRLEDAIKGAADKGTGAGYWDRLLPRVSIALDPYAPIRYKGMSFSMDGLGNALAEAFVQKRGLSNFANLFIDNILEYWLTINAGLSQDVGTYAGQIDKCRSFLRQNGVQFGIERCLYFLNPSVHCLSPLIENYYARTPEDFLRALNDVAGKKGDSLPHKIIDTHAACFLVCKDARLIEPYTYDLSSADNFRNILACAQILNSIQRFSKIEPVPHITNYLVNMMDPVISRFHKIDNQKQIRKELERKRSSGIIQDIIDIVENPDRIRNDQIDFRFAFKNYKDLETEKKNLELRLKNPKFNAEKSGREWAATISGIVSTLIIIGFIIVQFGNSSPL